MEKPRAGSADTYDTKQLLVERGVDKVEEKSKQMKHYENFQQKFHISFPIIPNLKLFPKSLCLKVFLSLLHLSGLSRSVIVMETRSFVCFEYNNGQESVHFAIYE